MIDNRHKKSVNRYVHVYYSTNQSLNLGHYLSNLLHIGSLWASISFLSGLTLGRHNITGSDWNNNGSYGYWQLLFKNSIQGILTVCCWSFFCHRWCNPSKKVWLSFFIDIYYLVICSKNRIEIWPLNCYACWRMLIYYECIGWSNICCW